MKEIFKHSLAFRRFNKKKKVFNFIYFFTFYKRNLSNLKNSCKRKPKEKCKLFQDNTVTPYQIENIWSICFFLSSISFRGIGNYVYEENENKKKTTSSWNTLWFENSNNKILNTFIVEKVYRKNKKIWKRVITNGWKPLCLI